MLKRCLASMRAAGGTLSLRRAIRDAIQGTGMASFLVLGSVPAQAAEKPAVPVRLISAVPGVLKNLSFDDPVSVIPGAAIDRLIMSGQVMGSRLRLKSGVELYFPDGFIVLAEAQQTDPVVISRLLDQAQTQFGRQCAEQSAGIRQYRLYRHPAGNLVLMELMGNAPVPDAARITEVLDADFLPGSGVVDKLKKQCGL